MIIPLLDVTVPLWSPVNLFPLSEIFISVTSKLNCSILFTFDENIKKRTKEKFLKYYFSFILYNIKKFMLSRIIKGKDIDKDVEILSVLPKTYEKLFK